MRAKGKPGIEKNGRKGTLLKNRVGKKKKAVKKKWARNLDDMRKE